MSTKKIMLILWAVDVLCFWPLANGSACDIKKNQEASLFEVNNVDANEQDMIAEGNASHGHNAITGKACIVMRRKDLSKICKGDIVIAPAIHSTWYSQLSIASCIIVEKDDGSGRAIAFGKKLGISIIVGVTGATKLIVDGQIITCDPITRRVYHSAHHESKGLHFDVIITPQKCDVQQALHDVIGKDGKVHANKIANSVTMAEVNDYFLNPYEEVQNIVAQSHHQPYKAKRITKDVYCLHFDKFKEYALKTYSQYNKWREWPRVLAAGARATGRDDFTIDCMAIGDVLLTSDKMHFVDVLKRIGEDQYVQYIDLLIDKCSERPKNISDINWVSRVSHKEHVKSVEMPEDIDKEKLMEHPKEYKKVENKVSREEREVRVAAGLFALYWIENKLPL